MNREKYIPKVDPSVIKELAEKIRPCMKFGDELCYVKPGADLFDESYVWDAEAGDKAENLTQVVDITTYHTYGYYGFFKPSVAEVLTQISLLSADVQEKIVAFELVTMPEDAADLNTHREATNNGVHVAKARLYASAEKYELKAGSFIRVRADHRNAFRAGHDGMVSEDSPADYNTVGLVFGFDRHNRGQSCVCVGPELWDKSELDRSTLTQ